MDRLGFVASASITALELEIQPNSVSITSSDASWFVRESPAPIGSAVQSSSTMHE
jgi:hypothetical protein